MARDSSKKTAHTRSGFDADDERYMREALRLAARGRGHTSPNPMVGTVIVKRGRVLARGWHHEVGQAHAEVDALSHIGGRAEGATVYVNLEPCNHHGRTGPCTDALLAAGVARVVVGMIDPNPIVNGGGLERLRKAGVRVDTGCLEAESRALNEAFVCAMTKRRAFVTLKLASTADGQLATRSGHSTWVTGEAAREYVHQERARSDAVMVGVGTVLADDPALNVRLVRGRDPIRIVVDSTARTPPTAKLLREGTSPVWIAVTPRAPARRVLALQTAGAQVLRIPADPQSRVELPTLLRIAAERGVLTLLCEGGARLAGALIGASLVDRVALFYAPKLLGGGRSMVDGPGFGQMTQALRLRDASMKRVGDDFLMLAAVEEALSQQ